MDQAAQGTDELHALGMLEHVAAHGKAGTARLEGVVHHFEEFAGGLGAGAARR